MTKHAAKQLINHPETVVTEMIGGLLVQDDNLAKLEGYKVLIRRDAQATRDTHVALLSGGGSGHEPAHAGYVGEGMLTGAVLGDVFASPTADAVLAAIRAVTGRAGCLLIVKNYTGDRLNFGLAAERARTEFGLHVEIVVVADDVALPDLAQPRGIAGTVLVHKVAGAAAAAGEPLEAVYAEAAAAARATVSLGVAFETCTLPGQPEDPRLAGDQIELGLGIHGEPGAETTGLKPVDELVDEMLSRLTSSPRFRAETGLALLVNNLGTATPLELALVTRRAAKVLGTQVTRVYSGSFLTALDMKGFSLSLLPLGETRLARLEALTRAPAWRPGSKAQNPLETLARTVAVPVAASAEAARPAHLDAAGTRLEAVMLAATGALIHAETDLNTLDRRVGDGDCGTTLRRGAERVRRDLTAYPLQNAATTLQALSASVAQGAGGSSGVLYAIFFGAGARELQNSGDWVRGLRAGTAAVATHGGATAGDRTMLDALLPACDAAEAARAEGRTGLAALEAAVTEAEAGAESTRGMEKARAGRSAYLGASALSDTVDPGAKAVSLWLRAVYKALRV